MEKLKSKKRKVFGIIGIVFLFILLIFGLLVRYATDWTIKEFGEIPFSQVVFHLMMPLNGTNDDIIHDFVAGAIGYIFPIFSLVLLIYIACCYFAKLKYTYIEISIKNKSVKIGLNDNILFKIIRKAIAIPIVIVLIINVMYGIKTLGIDTYLTYIAEGTKLYDREYVSPKDVIIVSPNKKKNVVHIILESMETSFCDKAHGGGMTENLIPGLTQLAIDNECFSEGDYLNGGNVTMNSSWTMAGIVSQTSGVPLTMPISANGLQGYKSFLNGVVTFGDILEKDGYNQMFMLGSDASFAGMDSYLKQHGNYTIWDRFSAVYEGKMKSGEEVWWGFEDGKLFEWAKEKILEMSSANKPFNMTINTIDTHHPDGLVIDAPNHKFEEPFDLQYENVIYNADINICEFIEWIKQQEFYEDTVIVISGDHLSMSVTVPNEMLGADYKRKTYFTIINSDTERQGNNSVRQYTTLDIYPTILAALGYEIEGDRLGLGTNLYSGKETLMEKYGIEYLNQEISKNSSYYNLNIFK